MGVVSEGIYAYSPSDTSVLLTEFTKIPKNFFKVPVFTDLTNAKNFVKEKTKQKHKLEKTHNFKSPFRFFLIKVDSSKFPAKIDTGCFCSKHKEKYQSLKFYYLNQK